MKSNVIVVTALVIISLLMSACHHGRHRNARHSESRAIEHLAVKLDLSSDQKIEVVRVQSAFVALKEEGKSIREDWYSYALKQFEVNGEKATEEAEFSRNQAVRMEKLGERFANTVAELKHILSSEQEKILVAELKKLSNHVRR